MASRKDTQDSNHTGKTPTLSYAFLSASMIRVRDARTAGARPPMMPTIVETMSAVAIVAGVMRSSYASTVHVLYDR